MYINYQAGYSLLATLVSSTIGMIACATALHFLYFTVNTYNKVQQKFVAQQNRLMARQLLGSDLLIPNSLATVCKARVDDCKQLTPSIQGLIEQRQIKPLSDVLVLQTQQDRIVYYLRKSNLKQQPANYALYRDDIIHNAVAIAENLQNFKVQIASTLAGQQQLGIELTFINNRQMRFTCILQQ
jgi:hypothetical protein